MMATMTFQPLMSSSIQQEQPPISTLLEEPIPNTRAVRRVSYDSLQQTAFPEIDSNLSVVSDDDDDSFYIHKRHLERSSYPEKKRRRTTVTTRKRLPSKMLRFAEEAAIIPSNNNTTPYCDSSSNNICWYTRSELSAMKSSCKRLALQSTPALKQELFTLHNQSTAAACPTVYFSDEFQYRRGLERWSSALHYQSRAMDILESKSAVFLQQSAAMLRNDTQQQQPEPIAIAYRQTTVKAKQFARALALADVQEALL